MEGIKRLLEKNPGLLDVSPLDPERKGRRLRYEKALKCDRVEEIAREFVNLASRLPNWKIDSFSVEKIFNFGKNIAMDFNIDLPEIERLFNKILNKYIRGGLLGFFISGLCRKVIKEKEVLKVDLTKYPASVSGLGYRHKCGRIEITGNKTYYVGVEMEGGEIVVRGSVGNYLGKSMKGGQIIIDGDARNWVGDKMEDGLILIKGNTGHVIGKGMTGGEIVIHGNVGHWVGEGAQGGTIRVKGLLQFCQDNLL
ncbi:MAG: hypothetical protein AB1638_08640 [Nitrospirota bacterium]